MVQSVFPRLAGLILLVCCGCGSALPPPPTIQSLDAWRAYSDALDPRLGTLQTRDSTWQMGDASAAFSAWFEEGELLCIHELISMGDYGQRRVRYYFQDGYLRYLREDGEILAGGEGVKPALQGLEREILYATDGQVLGWINFVGGKPLQLEPMLAAGAREHALGMDRK